MKDGFFRRLLFWLVTALSNTRIDNDRWNQILDWVREAETAYARGADKEEYVTKQIKDILGIAAPYLIKLLVSTAVGYLGKKGDIHLGSME